MALKEYVDKHSTKVLNTSGDAAKFDGSSPPMPDADTGISVKLDEVSPGVPTSDTRPEEKGATLPAPKSSGVHPMALLPIDPGSKLGRQLRLSATGAVESSYIFPIAIEDGKCLPRLNEFAQAAGLKTPTFTTMSRNAPDRPILDHFVSMIFNGFDFQDQRGRHSVKLGKEACARQCLEYFFPEQRPKDGKLNLA